MEVLFIAELRSNDHHEKVMIDVHFVKKILLEMVIGRQIKEEGHDQN